MTTPAENIATVIELYGAFGRGDVDTILGHMADDVEWDHGVRATGLPSLQPGAGKDHVASFFGALASNLEFTTFEPGTPCASDDTVMVALREVARNVVTGATVPEDTFVHIFRFGPDGKVVSFRHVGDWAPHEAAAQRRHAAATAK